MTDRPELMAIGDSIYNGTRSLTTNAELAQLSVPAQVARAFGWNFQTPTYPFDVLFNLEALFRAGAFDLGTLKMAVLANAQRWLDADPWADIDCFDNIAIAQTTIGDQARSTYLNHVSQIPPLLNQLRNAGDLDFTALAALYEAINTSFVLNPSRDPESEWADKTPLEIVAARRPKRLLVNIGINDGIWTVCLEAIKTELDPAAIAADMHDLGVRLAAMKAAGDMQAIDQEILALNQAISDDFDTLFPNGGVSFVDTYALLAERDDKHFRDSKPIWVRNWRLNNVPLQGFSHKGGQYGLDNLHPTTVGYAALAQAVCEQIVITEGIKPAQPVDFTAAFDSDSLLTNVPPLLDVENLLIDLVVAFVRLARPMV